MIASYNLPRRLFTSEVLKKRVDISQRSLLKPSALANVNHRHRTVQARENLRRHQPVVQHNVYMPINPTATNVSSPGSPMPIQTSEGRARRRYTVTHKQNERGGGIP